MIRFTRSIALAAVLAMAAAGAAYCDEYYSNHGFSIDLPEGFDYLEGDGATKFSFGFPDGGVRVDMLVYPPTRFANAKAGAADTARKLSGRGDFASFELGGHDAALGEMRFGAGGSAYRGYGFFLNDAESPLAEGAPDGSKPAKYDLVVLSYSTDEDYEAYRDVIASAIDGFSANYNRRAAPGPLGAAARAAVLSAKPQAVSIKFGAATIRAQWNPQEAAAAQALVEREYRVLSAYADSPDLVDAAIARFYRMVFRDAAPSLDRLALDMSAAWETGAWSGERLAAPSDATTGKEGSPKFGAAAEPRGYAEALLSWVQGFRYERDPKGSDVVNPISAAFELRGDCDSRALVMAILLRRENVRSILMISLEHEHALAAVDAPGPGARFPFNDTNWLVAETTAKVGIGLVDASQADPASWIGIEFPD